MRYFDIYDSAIVYNALTFIIPVLYVNNLKTQTRELIKICKTIKYKFTLGQKLMIYSTLYSPIRVLTKLPLSTLIKTNNYKLYSKNNNIIQPIKQI